MRLLKAYAHEQAELLRKAVGHHALALDQSGIAEGCFPARCLAIDEGHAAATSLKMNGGRYADNAGSEHDDVSLS
jgi:hypothetical protein